MCLEVVSGSNWSPRIARVKMGGAAAATKKELRLYVSMTRTKGPPGQPVDVATMAGEEMLRWLRDIDGFNGLMMLSNEASATTLALTFWRSREAAERHRVA